MINVYIDTTGSMVEMGKDSATMYIVKSIEDYCRFKSIETSFYKLDGTKITTLEKIIFSNDLKLNFDIILENNILISDGLFDFEHENLFDVSIDVGIDANQLHLNKISKKLFSHDNIIMALEYLIYNNQLLENSLKTPDEDDEDEW
jgi:hypothetical protein